MLSKKLLRLASGVLLLVWVPTQIQFANALEQNDLKHLKYLFLDTEQPGLEGEIDDSGREPPILYNAREMDQYGFGCAKNEELTLKQYVECINRSLDQHGNLRGAECGGRELPKEPMLDQNMARASYTFLLRSQDGFLTNLLKKTPSKGYVNYESYFNDANKHLQVENLESGQAIIGLDSDQKRRKNYHDEANDILSNIEFHLKTIGGDEFQSDISSLESDESEGLLSQPKIVQNDRISKPLKKMLPNSEQRKKRSLGIAYLGVGSSSLAILLGVLSLAGVLTGGWAIAAFIGAAVLGGGGLAVDGIIQYVNKKEQARRAQTLRAYRSTLLDRYYDEELRDQGAHYLNENKTTIGLTGADIGLGIYGTFGSVGTAVTSCTVASVAINAKGLKDNCFAVNRLNVCGADLGFDSTREEFLSILKLENNFEKLHKLIIDRKRDETKALLSYVSRIARNPHLKSEQKLALYQAISDLCEKAVSLYGKQYLEGNEKFGQAHQKLLQYWDKIEKRKEEIMQDKQMMKEREDRCRENGLYSLL